MANVYAVEILIVRRENFSNNQKGLQFSTTRIQSQGMRDEFFEKEADARSFLREWMQTHRGEARIATFRVQGTGNPLAQTDASLQEGRAWLADLSGYTPDLREYGENMKKEIKIS